ncbi:MAG: hypothetical protein P8010_18505, partial [Desulfosarcinaceae bacterium]
KYLRKRFPFFIPNPPGAAPHHAFHRRSAEGVSVQAGRKGGYRDEKRFDVYANFKGLSGVNPAKEDGKIDKKVCNISNSAMI